MAERGHDFALFIHIAAAYHIDIVLFGIQSAADLRVFLAVHSYLAFHMIVGVRFTNLRPPTRKIRWIFLINIIP